MANLEVSFILDDPAFRTDGLICSRFNQTVGNDGIAVNTPETPVTFSGSVYPKDGANLVRLPDGSRVHETQTIVTKFQLQSQGIGLAADIVTLKGAQYTITDVNPWDYGIGFVEATAQLLPLSGG